MRKLALALVGGLAGLAIVWVGATIVPFAALFWQAARESLLPSTVSWDAKGAWVKCDGAIAGTVPWPQAPAAACEAMHLCANEAPLTPDQQASLKSAMRRLPNCGDP
jgi:hypothetical protein